MSGNKEMEQQNQSNPYSDSKFQRFAASIERTLKGFEVTKEWQDLISCLAKLHKVLLAYAHFKIVPHKHLICKRLSQCLHPNLPGGVHLKVLEVYRAIFDRIGKDGMSRDLFIYTSGLYPLFDHASMQVRPQLLDVFEQYLIPLGPGLLPGLQGFIMALLPGLEEGSESIQRVTLLIDSTSTISPSAFAISLWNTLYRCPSLRQPTAEYMMSHLSKGKSQICQLIKRIDEHPDILVMSLCACLQDGSILVVRSALDLTTTLLPLNSTSLSSHHFTMVTTAVLHTLTKRDSSLSRRVYSWLLGNLQQKSPIPPQADDTIQQDSSTMYFTSFIYPKLTAAIKLMLKHVDINPNTKQFDKTNHLSPHRILKALTERNELHKVLLDMLPDYLIFLRHQMNQLKANEGDQLLIQEGQKKSNDNKSSSLRNEMFHAVNHFLCGLNRDMLWEWMRDSLLEGVASYEGGVASSEGGVVSSVASTGEGVDRKQLILTLLQFLPQQNSEPIVSSFLPILIQHWINSIDTSFVSLSLADLSSHASFTLALLNLLNRFIQTLSTGTTPQPHSYTDSSEYSSSCGAAMFSTSFSSPRTTPTNLLPSSEDGEGTTPEVYISLLRHLKPLFVSCLNLLSRFIMVHAAKLGDHNALRDSFVKVLKKFDNRSCSKERFFCGTNEKPFEEITNVFCRVVALCADMTMSVANVMEDSAIVNNEDIECAPSPFGLMLSCLCTHNAHIFISSLSTLVRLWGKEKETTSLGLDMIKFFGNFSLDARSKKDFIKLVSVFLWDSLSQSSLIAHHRDISSLLYELHSLSLPGSVVEDVMLEKFADKSVVPYQAFLVFWKYSLFHKKTTSLFKRLLLRVLEGVQSTEPAISQCSTMWIKTLSETKQLSAVLLPLYNLIIDATPPKRLPQYESPRTPKPYQSRAAQYYFATITTEEEEADEEEGPPYPIFYFSQTVDSPRLRYGLSLFLSLLAIDPVAICVHLASTYMAPSSGYSSPITTSTEASHSPSTSRKLDAKSLENSLENSKTARPKRLYSAVAKSLLELILTYCSHILLTDYSAKLDVSNSDIMALTNIKITSANLIVDLLACVTTVVSGLTRPACTEGSNLTNPTYILCLLALCEVQKSVLISLLQLVDIFKNIPSDSTKSQTTDSLPNGGERASTKLYSLSNSLPHLQPLFLQLLKALYYGICLESLATNIAESPASLKKSKKEITQPEEGKGLVYVPGMSLVLQPVFFHILNSVLSRSHLVLQQTYLLSIVCHAMIHFRESLEIIAPKILKQVYRNLKELLTEKDHARNPKTCSNSSESIKTDSNGNESSWQSNERLACQSDELIAVYMCTISNVIHYSLLHKQPQPNSKESLLHFKLVDTFWNLPALSVPKNEASLNESLSSSSGIQEKSGFSFGWLFGGVFNSTSEVEPDKPVEKGPQYCGVYAPVGQKVLWQLQHVYGVVVRVWREGLSDDRTVSAVLKRDLHILVKQFLEPMASYNSTLFYTTVAQTWMHWNLVGKSKQTVKESFINLLHSYKLQPLDKMLVCIKNTLESMTDTGEEISVERQKYMLHFLHYYLSSPLQSVEEMTSSFSAFVVFIKDTHYSIFNGVNATSSSSTSLLCMLTSILHVFVHRVPVPDVQTNKKQRKEMQDIIYKLCESLSFIVDGSLTPKLQAYHNQLALQQQQVSKETDRGVEGDKGGAKGSRGVVNDHIRSTTGDCEVQVLAMLSNVLSRFIDSVYSNEGDKVSYLLKIILKPTWLILKSYSPPTKAVYPQAVRLLSSICDFQITRKFWKDEVLEIFLEQHFFTMEKNSIQNWKLIIDNLISQDKTMFSQILSRIPLSSVSPAAGMVSMFLSIDQERKYRSKLLKRLAFIIMCGEHNQYIGQIHEISEKLMDSIRCFSCPSVSTQVLLALRVLLVRVSADGLVSLWPILLTELTSAFTELQSDLGIELATPQPVNREKLVWYWSACRLLETLVLLPSNVVPHWQFVSWGYFGASFGDSLESDIAETDDIVISESVEDLSVQEERVEETSNGSGSTGNEVSLDRKRIASTSNDNWCIIDEILQVYKSHTQDTKQAKLSYLAKLPMAYEVKTVTQLVGFLQGLCAKEASSCILASSGNKSVTVDELSKTILLDFID